MQANQLVNLFNDHASGLVGNIHQLELRKSKSKLSNELIKLARLITLLKLYLMDICLGKKETQIKRKRRVHKAKLVAD